MKREARIRHYMGKAYDQTMVVDSSQIPAYLLRYSQRERMKGNNTSTYYVMDMERHVQRTGLHHAEFLFYDRDRVEPFDLPTLVKSRPLQDHGQSILFNLNSRRHFGNVCLLPHKDTLPYHQKRDALIWRGSDTGYGFGNDIPPRDTSRETLVQRFHTSSSPHLDIGLSGLVNQSQSPHHATRYSAYLKPSLSLKEMLQYKMVLCVEGNDVASGLKWVLASTCLPVCPPPTMESWIMEGHLEPYTHYLPVRSDFSDVEEKVEWALGHPQLCEDMVKAGQHYMKPFQDVKEENAITTEILRRYHQNVRFL